AKRAGSLGAHERRGDHGCAPQDVHDRRRAVSSRERADAAGSAAHGGFLEAHIRDEVRMSTLKETLERLLERKNLSEQEASDLLVALTDGSLHPAMGGALLTALRMKGVTADEVRGFARTMRKLARRPVLSPGSPLVDMVGTGGDGSGSF